MIINHKKRFVFVHVARTGGNSGYAMLGRSSKGGLHRSRSQANKPQYWSFGFIRNPWARMVSMYLHHRRLHFNPDDPHQYPEASESFEHYLVNTKHWHSACELLAGCDYIASFENFEEEWVAILRKLGMGPPEKGIPKKNAAIERYDYRTFYNDLTAAVVGKRWADDVELGPYSF